MKLMMRSGSEAKTRPMTTNFRPTGIFTKYCIQSHNGRTFCQTSFQGYTSLRIFRAKMRILVHEAHSEPGSENKSHVTIGEHEDKNVQDAGISK